ncbi:MAG: FliH/SctL family protein [Candidatus Binataceae bacterium]
MSSKVLRPGDAGAPSVSAWRPAGVLSPAPRSENVPAADPQRETEARIQAAYEQGKAAGEAAAAEKMNSSIIALNRAAQELAGARQQLRKDAETAAVKLSIAIARRVLYRELATDPEAILGLVIAAFQKLSARETQRLRVSPACAAIVQENRARLDLPPGLEISADPSLAAGGAVFETSRGELDASVDTQLAEIERGFADIMRRG